MKTMKKLIAISLAVVMLVAVLATMSVPAFAHSWTSQNTTGMILTPDKEMVVNAGKLPTADKLSDGEIKLGVEDSDWQYAYPYALNKKYSAGRYNAAVDADVYIMYDSTNLYIREVRRDTVNASDLSEYKIIVPGVTLSADTFTPVGVHIRVDFTGNVNSDNIADRANRLERANVLGYKWSPDNIGDNTNYRKNMSSFVDKVSSYSHKEGDNFVVETAIPWANIAVDGKTYDVGSCIGFMHQMTTNGGTNKGYSKVYALKNVGSGHTAGNKVYHDEWDGFSPLYLRDVNEDASSYAVDMSWYNTTDTVFTLNTVGQLRGLSALVNMQADSNAAKAITQGKTFKLGADMNLNPGWNTSSTAAHLYTWTPISFFEGTLDGQGHEIRGVVCDYTWNNVTMSGHNWESCDRQMAFISYVSGNAVIKNTMFMDAKVTSTWAGATVIAACQKTSSATLENLYVESNVTTNPGSNTDQHASLLVGRLVGGPTLTLKNIVLTGKVKVTTTKTNYAAVLWGNIEGERTVVENVYAHNVTLDATNTRWGGFHGGNDKANKTNYYRFDGGKLYDVGASPDAWAKKEVNSYPAGWVNIDESNTIKMPASVAAMVDSDLWVQERINETNMDIRVLTVLDAKEDWTAFGVKVEMEINGAFVEIPGGEAFKSSKVYNSINAAGVKKSAAELGGKYVGGIVLTNSPKTVKLRITPVKYVGEQAYYGGSSVIEYVNGVFQ